MEERFYRVGGQLKAEINVYATQEDVSAPSIFECRYAVLSLKNGHVIYDRLLCRIVNGVFYAVANAEELIQVARRYNSGQGTPDMSPNGLALGLTYPTNYPEESDDDTI